MTQSKEQQCMLLETNQATKTTLLEADTMNAYHTSSATPAANATAGHSSAGSQISLIGAQQNDLLRALSRDDLLALFRVKSRCA